MLIAETENGSLYGFTDDMEWSTRLPEDEGARLRGDFQWVRVLNYYTIEVGRPMRLLLQIRDDGIPTTRDTGIVTNLRTV
jgi:hypothetical protein